MIYSHIGIPKKGIIENNNENENATVSTKIAIAPWNPPYMKYPRQAMNSQNIGENFKLTLDSFIFSLDILNLLHLIRTSI